MNPAQQKVNTTEFVECWQSEPGNEEEQSRSFWIQLLEEVLGAPNATHVLQFERKVKGRKIDVFYEDMGVLIEQKGRGISLDEATVRSKKAGPETPYQQARWYANNLPFSIRPRWIITCNFDEIRVYDQDTDDPDSYEPILLENLPDEAYRLSFFTDKRHSRIEREKQLSVEAGEIVGRLYSQLASQYKNIDTNKHEQYSLNVLVVRLVFLLYAEDAGLLQRKDAFLDYMKSFDAAQMRGALINLFKTLDTPPERRDPYASPALLEFPYINGDLYSDKRDVVIPQFTDQIRLDLLLEASQKFNWSKISPTIFGAVFESALNPETRRAGGMHYTSIENIHKAIDPLFMNDLKAELEKIEGEKVEKNRRIKLKAFQKKLASINVFDPACGSGNFLTESYLSLRRLENRVIESLQGDQISFELDTAGIIQVSISQFFGIEINDFAVSVAKTALWIAEEQMMEATQEIVLAPFDFLPLKTNSNIHEGNALRMDWNGVIPAEKCTYICGNPPFVGTNWLSDSQREDMDAIWSGTKRGKLDYVSCWYVKSANYMKGNRLARCAFVSTNSICQGEQEVTLWNEMLVRLGVKIDFAHRSFVWNSEAVDEAHVHVVIVGFSYDGPAQKLLYTEDTLETCDNINGYLLPAPSVFVTERSTPLCNVPTIVRGSQATDDGNYLMTPEERADLLSKNPAAARYLRRFMMGREFLNGIERWCIWTPDITQPELSEHPEIQSRIEAVRKFREASRNAQTRKAASTPWRFGQFRPPASHYVAFAKVSSQRRIYIPFGFMTDEVIPGDKLFTVPNAELYHFGVLQSIVHSAWMRVVAGRLKSDYSYSTTIVYNDFPWPNVTRDNIEFPVRSVVPEERCRAIEECAKKLLEAREAHPGKSLADLYDPDKMPADLFEAHKAVEAAYGVDFQGDEEKIVAHLFKLYAELTSE